MVIADQAQMSRRLSRVWRSRHRILVTLSIAYLGAVIFAAIFADWIAPFGYNDQNLLARLQPPSLLGGPEAYLFGTDELGRDVLSRLLFALRISLFVAGLGSFIGAVFGTLLGLLAAHFRGLVDEVLAMLIDMQGSVPFLIFALAALGLFGNSLTLFVILLGLYGWESYARLVRGLAMSSAGSGYVEALRSLGFHPIRIYVRHVIPNVAGSLIVQLTLSIPAIILMESSLSFLGLGIQPPLTSLGLMIGTGREFLLTAWWTAVIPGIAIFLTSLAITIVGDWLRDRLEGVIDA